MIFNFELSSAAQYVLLGAEEGLFSLQVIANNPDPVMEQVGVVWVWPGYGVGVVMMMGGCGQDVWCRWVC